MKALLEQLVAGHHDGEAKRRLAREYLQARILQSLQDHGVFARWAFLGGTALRFLYGLPRYSEDLDFSLVEGQGDVDRAGFERLVTRITAELRGETYEVDTAVKTSGAVYSAYLRFRGLPHELGISPHRQEVLPVRIELDSNPPAGAGTRTRVLRRYILLNLLHYDCPSLFAGKLHAVLTRGYTKGRDLYDLVWYLSDPSWPGPNIALLNNALQQTDPARAQLTEDTWRDAVRSRLDRVDWARAVDDLSPFVERRQELELVNRETIESLLAQNT